MICRFLLIFIPPHHRIAAMCRQPFSANKGCWQQACICIVPLHALLLILRFILVHEISGNTLLYFFGSLYGRLLPLSGSKKSRLIV